MTSVQWLAFVITPLGALALGWGVALWARHAGRPGHGTPAE